MIRVRKYLAYALSLFLLSSIYAETEKGAVEPDPMVTHADAAVIFAKYSGLFDRYVSKDADLSECVTFLNKIGIYFGFLEVAGKAEFSEPDCARVMAQAALVFGGKAEYVGGKVKLPESFASWQEYCLMNDVKYMQGYQKMKEFMRVASQRNR